ncbi:MAG: hypothetical protein KDB03_12780 [Planctomycetales bacterium]|nr:hypothetical protein [Planctomycetales bacterium]
MLDQFYCILGVNILVRCEVPELADLVAIHWGHLATGPTSPDLSYSVERSQDSSEIAIHRDSLRLACTYSTADFLYALESDSTVQVQLLRRNFYFLHAATAEVNGEAHLLVAQSGGGKSTTLWGLLHHGWRYMSDELAVIDLDVMQVVAYPRALCLKNLPPISYPLPAEAAQTDATYLVAAKHLPLVSQLESCLLRSIYFVQYCPQATTPSINSIGAAEATARLYANSLNQLSHAGAGLDAAIRIANSAKNFRVETCELGATCRMIETHLRKQD